MKNLIYVAAFYKESCIQILKLLINSIAANGNIEPDNTDILILTSLHFLPKIQTEFGHLQLPLKYHLLECNTLIDAVFARLFIFSIPQIELYNKLLYLDLDILINGDLNVIWNLDISPDKIYALEEGNIGGVSWGGPDFFDFSKEGHDPNTPAFTSGILLFRNSYSIKQLFQTIRDHAALHIIEDKPMPRLLDQPFIVYNAVVQRKYDNQILKLYAENNPTEASQDKIIYHFPGGIGHFASKYDRMTEFLKKMRNPQSRKLVKIMQYGEDGFGHQLEGTLRLMSMSLNNKATYFYRLGLQYKFEHSNFDQTKLERFFHRAREVLFRYNNSIPESFKPVDVILRETRSFQHIADEDKQYENYIYLYDGVGCGQKLPANFEMPEEIAKSLPLLRKAFVEENPILPPPSYGNHNNGCKTVCCHIRLGDAVGTRKLETDKLYEMIRKFQSITTPIQIVVHSDGYVGHLRSQNTKICDSRTDVLQVLSDFIHADILIMNYSSLSIASHLLAKPSQIVVCPDNAGVTFNSRILNKCIRVSTMFDLFDTLVASQQQSIHFVNGLNTPR